MRRFFNREALFSALILFLISATIAYFSPLDIRIRWIILFGIPALFHWPVAIWFQDKILSFYVDNCFYDSALRLAVTLKEVAMDRWMRQDATLNVAFVQLAKGDYPAALRNLKSIIVTRDHPITKCVVNSTTGYCLARMGQDLDKAEEMVAGGIESIPDSGIFVSFLALIRLRQGRFEEAKLLLEKAQELEDDPKQPHPGEMGFMMAQAFAGLGDLIQAKACLELSAAACKRGFFSLKAKKILDSGNLSALTEGLVVTSGIAASNSTNDSSTNSNSPNAPSSTAPTSANESSATTPSVDVTTFQTSTDKSKAITSSKEPRQEPLDESGKIDLSTQAPSSENAPLEPEAVAPPQKASDAN